MYKPGDEDSDKLAQLFGDRAVVLNIPIRGTMRNILITALAMYCTLLMIPTDVNAGTANAGTVLTVLSQSNGGTGGEGVVFFSLSTTHGGAPSCHTQGTRWVVDLGKASGLAHYEIVLSAFHSGKRISVVGTGNCSIWGDTEGVHYLMIQ